ncbi:MAG: DegT/DnrJ/EryC1/StrS family aminotransferase [Candidatus Poribacteria bacterium]|nr:DegT/DnrJ/EryC1/StrS family aminotransferase [Candidatus Poribacteria bacterium]MDE0504930.1 DegT/DnrJ/EryC1/StrS family aminotransferase [Candidatus Poribacteria bacterium]
MPEENLAIDGGKPIRNKPLPDGNKFGREELRELTDVIDSGVMSRFGGTKVEQFENEFAGIHGAKYGIASSSGTASLHIAVGMLNPSPGDEIIVGPITDVGSVIPILAQTAIPIFCDVQRDTFNMHPEDIERKIRKKTKAIMAVHVFGNPCDMDAIMSIAKRHNLTVIEDCSQAHLSEYKGRLVGTIGDIACFSLQQSKHISCGDGGITITNNDDYGTRGKLFMDKGWDRSREGQPTYVIFAPNYRMNELSGAVALAQVRKMRNTVAQRRARGDLLSELCKNPYVVPQRVLDGCKHTYWLYAMQVKDDAPFTPEDFAAAMRAEGISCTPHFFGRPVFLSHEAVRDQRLFGNSRFPFDHPDANPVSYDENTAPNAQKVYDQMIVGYARPRVNQQWATQFLSEEDIHDIARAIKKVSRHLRTR